MTQQGFEDYVFTVFGHKAGTAKSYITAIRIIDKMLAYDDVFGLGGTSITCVNNPELLNRIVSFVCEQQTLYINGEPSIFRNIDPGQVSYPKKRFCSAAVKQLLHYQAFELREAKADALVTTASAGSKVSSKLIEFFSIDKVGSDKLVETTVRIGQHYFRKMVLANYDNKCCITGLNVPQTLRASHIVAWKEDKKNRMNPENGLCLSATYDAAFDRHLISFDEDYRMIISREIKEYYTNQATKDYFEKYEGSQINLPIKFLPSQKLLEKHRKLIVY
ncbi:MAG: HNH endonuclease [Bacteroidales bacterium]|nr:HNH endonuclease [Candidatus Colimorpha merdihippi]